MWGEFNKALTNDEALRDTEDPAKGIPCRKERFSCAILASVVISQYGNNEHFIQSYFSIAPFMGMVIMENELTPTLMMSKLGFQEAKCLV